MWRKHHGRVFLSEPAGTLLSFICSLDRRDVRMDMVQCVLSKAVVSVRTAVPRNLLRSLPCWSAAFSVRVWALVFKTLFWQATDGSVGPFCASRVEINHLVSCPFPWHLTSLCSLCSSSRSRGCKEGGRWEANAGWLTSKSACFSKILHILGILVEWFKKKKILETNKTWILWYVLVNWELRAFPKTFNGILLLGRFCLFWKRAAVSAF